jgi:hypothetical protein
MSPRAAEFRLAYAVWLLGLVAKKMTMLPNGAARIDELPANLVARIRECIAIEANPNL